MRRIITLLMIMMLFFIYFTASADTGPGKSVNTNEQIPAGDTIKNILKKVSPSIVKVVSENQKRYIATGIIIDTNHVISSAMVTNHPYESLYIETVSGDQYDAVVLGKDQETSLLLLQISERSLPPIPKAKELEVGDWVGLVGVFYQEFPTIFQGFISSETEDRLILNAPVAPGSAGGAVINKKGELVGVVRGLFDFSFTPDYTYRDQSYEFLIRGNRASNKDMCYAVPMTKVIEVVKDLQKYGKIMRGWLGVALSSRGKNDSTEISDVALDSPAEKAGFRRGDRILSIKNKPVQTGSDLVRIIKTLKPGDNVNIEFARDNMKKTAKVLICEPKQNFEWRYPVPSLIENANFPPVIPEIDNTLPRVENFIVNFSGSRSLGVDVMPLTPELAQKFNIKEGTGLLISKVHKQTAAEKSGFQAADIIVKAGGKLMKQNIDLKKAINDLSDNQPIAINIYRSGQLKTLNVVPNKDIDQRSGQYPNMLEMFQDRLNEIKARMGTENEIAGDEKDTLYRLRKDAEIIKYRAEIERLKKQLSETLKQLEEVKKQKIPGKNSLQN